MQTQLHNLKFVLKFIQSHKVAKLVARAGVATLFGLCITGAAVGGHVEGSGKVLVARTSRTSSAPSCPRGEHTYTSTQGYTSDGTTRRSDLIASESASHNGTSHIRASNESMTTCIPDGRTTSLTIAKRALHAARASMVFMRAQALVASAGRNTFPYGVCTWYADQRYHELHGIYVPWSGDANAWPLSASAYGWRVSSAPRVGSIIALQSGVQGAGALGHVGVVEQVKGNSVIASSMNWGASPGAVTRWQFHPGPGVTFIGQ